MKRIILFMLLAVVGFIAFKVFWSFYFSEPIDTTISVSDSLRRQAMAESRFAFRLYSFQAEEMGESGNILLAPTTVYQTLAPLAAGSTNQTHKQMTTALEISDWTPAIQQGFSDLRQTRSRLRHWYQINEASSAWIDQSVLVCPGYTKTLSEVFGIAVKRFDIKGQPAKAQKQMADWITQTSQGRIQYVPQLDKAQDTAMILFSSIYFQSHWKNRFQPAKPFPFISQKGQKINWPFLEFDLEKASPDPLAYYEDELIQAVFLPFAPVGYRTDYEFVILLPQKIEQTSELERRLDSTYWQTILNSRSYRSGLVRIPRFSLSKTESLKPTLQKAGITDCFDPDRADFSLITENSPLWIDQFVTDVRLDVTETGVEAAAVSFIATAECVQDEQGPFQFSATHPFLFLLREVQTDSILFIGRFSPEEGTETSLTGNGDY